MTTSSRSVVAVDVIYLAKGDFPRAFALGYCNSDREGDGSEVLVTLALVSMRTINHPPGGFAGGYNN
jgi:hypothetical protein